MASVVIIVWGLAATVALVTRDVAVLSIVTSVMVIVASGLMVAWSRNGRGNGAS